MRRRPTDDAIRVDAVKKAYRGFRSFRHSTHDRNVLTIDKNGKQIKNKTKAKTTGTTATTPTKDDTDKYTHTHAPKFTQLAIGSGREREKSEWMGKLSEYTQIRSDSCWAYACCHLFSMTFSRPKYQISLSIRLSPFLAFRLHGNFVRFGHCFIDARHSRIHIVFDSSATTAIVCSHKNSSISTWVNCVWRLNWSGWCKTGERGKRTTWKTGNSK